MNTYNKTGFTLVFNTQDTTSWNGNAKYDAIFFINLKGFLRPEEFNTPYKVYITFQSTEGNIGIFDLYSLSVDIGSNYRILKNRQFSNQIGILGKTSTTTDVFFNLGSDYNNPVYIQNLNDMNQVRVQIIDLASGSIAETLTCDYTLFISFVPV